MPAGSDRACGRAAEPRARARGQVCTGVMLHGYPLVKSLCGDLQARPRRRCAPAGAWDAAGLLECGAHGVPVPRTVAAAGLLSRTAAGRPRPQGIPCAGCLSV